MKKIFAMFAFACFAAGSAVAADDCTAFGPSCMTDTEFFAAQEKAFGADCSLCITDAEFKAAQEKAHMTSPNVEVSREFENMP